MRRGYAVHGIGTCGGCGVLGSRCEEGEMVLLIVYVNYA